MQALRDEIPTRSYSGDKWKTNKTNKKYLAIDFKNRCAYCNDWDSYNGGYRNYHVEHFAPKERFPHLIYRYENLLYSCPYCNLSKSDKWPSDDEAINVVEEEGFLDPCTSEYYQYIYRNEDGSIGYRGELGKYIFTELNLGLMRHKILYRQEELNTLIEKLERKINKKKTRGEDTESLEKQLIPMLREFRLGVNSLNT